MSRTKSDSPYVTMPVDFLRRLAVAMGSLGVIISKVPAPSISTYRNGRPRPVTNKVRLTFWANTTQGWARTDGKPWKVPSGDDLALAGFWDAYNAALAEYAGPAAAVAPKKATKATKATPTPAGGYAAFKAQRMAAGATATQARSEWANMARKSVKVASTPATPVQSAPVVLPALPAGTTFRVNADGTFTIC